MRLSANYCQYYLHPINTARTCLLPCLLYRAMLPTEAKDGFAEQEMAITKLLVDRVTNLKSEGMQNQPTSVFSVRSTLGMIEITLQIGETLEKVCEITILNHKHKYKKWLHDKDCTWG